MGIMTRKQGTEYVIGSDRCSTDAPTNRAPKGRPNESQQVWTGENWSTVMAEAKTFDTLGSADEYVRANFAKVTGQVPLKKPTVRRPRPAPAPAPAAN